MKINGKEYIVPEIDYNAICELEKYSVNLLSGEMPSAFVLLRGFLALTMGNKVAAGREIEEHILKKGVDSLTDAFEEISKAIEDSGFLQQMRRKAEEEEKAEAGRRKAAKSLPKSE